VAANPVTPPAGVTSFETGFAGRLADGPSALAGVVVVQIGLTSAAVGAAGPPGIWGEGLDAWAGTATGTPTAMMAATDAIPRTVPRLARTNTAKAPARPIPTHRRTGRQLQLQYR
jgi:hypothetical protein